MLTADHQTVTADLLNALVDEIGERLHAGQSVDIDEYIAAYPQCAASIRELWPTIQALAQFGAASAEGDESGGSIPPPQALGDFRILREIGRGGMGVVYEAEQLSLGRRVAIKIMPYAAMLDERTLARFRNEARAAATLFHPNIVPIFFVGAERGVHFYAMQLIEGASLAEVVAAMRQSRDQRQETRAGALSVVRGQSSVEKDIPATDDGQLTTDQSEICNLKSAIETEPIAVLATERSSNPRAYFRRVAEIGIQAAEALDHAHEHGIIHRDVKPGNLLLDGRGKLWVADFGLARIGADPSMTASGDLVGTLRYMSPEQLSPTRTSVDHRTDVYSLGVTLYELITLRPAFASGDRHELMQQIAAIDPPPARQVNSHVPLDLQTILAKAVEKDPADRYASAANLAADLRRFLENKPVSARRPSFLARTRKWSRRHPSLVVATLIALTVSLVASLAAAGLAKSEQEKTADALAEARANLQVANAERQRAEQNLRFALAAVDDMYMQLATDWLANDTAPSSLQKDFLARAAGFYDQAARQVADDPSQREFLAVAIARSGQIAAYLQQYDAALERLQNSIALGEQLLTADPTWTKHRADLLPRYRLLSEVLMQQGKCLEADEAARAGLAHAQQLVALDPKHVDYRHSRADLQLQHAAILAGFPPERYLATIAADANNPLTDHLQLAAELARMARATLRETRTADNLPRLVARRFEADLVLSRILHYQGDFPLAAETAQAALRQCRSERNSRYGDYRPLVMHQAALLEQLGETAEAEGRLEEALEHYTASLDLQRQLLKRGQEPDLFMVRSFLGPDGGGDANFEPVPFIRYVETQLRLARVLEKLGRPYAAEEALGEAHLTSMIVASDNLRVLRFQVASANAWTLAAGLVADRRPKESKVLLAHAADLWRDALAEFPHAADYHSGVHGSFTDWTWFRLAHPVLAQQIERDAEKAPGAGAGEERQWQVLNLPNNTAFASGATARSWFRGSMWDAAIGFLREAADAREDGAAYWGLHLAMAHAKLGQHEDAQKWYDQASDAIDKADPPEPELIALRDRTRQLLADRENPDRTSSGD